MECKHGNDEMNLTEYHINSLLIALCRVIETKRNVSSPLIQDPYTPFIFDDLSSHLNVKESIYSTSSIFDTLLHSVAIRTRFIDDWLKLGSIMKDDGSTESSSSIVSMEHLEDETDTSNSLTRIQKQIVNLGAGFCTRSYRLNGIDHLVLYEVDDVNILNAKANSLDFHFGPPAIHVKNIDGDMTNLKTLASNLIESGYNTNIPTDWIAEGAIECLEEIEIVKLLRTLRKLSCTGSRIVLYCVEPSVKEYIDSIYDKFHSHQKLGKSCFSCKTFVRKEIGVQMLRDAGWSNVYCFGDDEAWKIYRRAQNLPIFILTAVASDKPTEEEYVNNSRIRTRTRLYLDPNFVKRVNELN